MENSYKKCFCRREDFYNFGSFRLVFTTIQHFDKTPRPKLPSFSTNAVYSASKSKLHCSYHNGDRY
jgi:hypothetical protein